MPASTDTADTTTDTDFGPPSIALAALGRGIGKLKTRGRHGATASAWRSPSWWEIDDSDVIEVPGPAKRQRQHQGQSCVTTVASDEHTRETQSSIYVSGVGGGCEVEDAQATQSAKAAESQSSYNPRYTLAQLE